MRLIPILCVLALGATGCTSTSYNVTFAEGAFRVADELEVTPGQSGDDGSNTDGGSTAGGAEASPGGSNLLRGSAQQGNIFQFGTAARPTTTTDAKASATVQSPNSQTGSGDEVENTDGGPADEPAE